MEVTDGDDIVSESTNHIAFCGDIRSWRPRSYCQLAPVSMRALQRMIGGSLPSLSTDKQRQQQVAGWHQVKGFA